MFRVVENIRLKHLDWVQTILASKHWTQHRLAKEAGLSPSALNKFINDPANSRTLNSYTIEKLEAASGVPLSGGGKQADHNPFLAHEAELVPTDDPLVRSYLQGNNFLDAWRMNSRALELAGYIPGDILLVDPTTQPQRGDVVLADVPDGTGGREMIIRIYEAPFLLTSTMDQRLMTPILIIHDIMIRGVVAHSIRNRRAA